jgi:hypothetical protein
MPGPARRASIKGALFASAREWTHFDEENAEVCISDQTRLGRNPAATKKPQRYNRFNADAIST